MNSHRFNRDPSPIKDPYSAEIEAIRPEAIRAILSEADDDRVLGLLEDGDPIGLHLRCLRWLERLCLILDEEELEKFARGRVVVTRRSIEPTTTLGEWLDDRIGDTAEALMARDEFLVRSRAPITRPLQPRFAVLAQVLGIEICNTRKATVVINGLGEDVKGAFFHLMYKQRSLEEYSASIGVDSSRTKALLRQALSAVSLMSDEDHDPWADMRGGDG